ncbi:hypothetical protein N0V95_003081 [Ascochyta clinopodiicola]|nr:hypothetical protein N0V95_003081 [Ascochyta clinopodiicola]
MASRATSTALRFGARTAQRTAIRAVVLPAKEASMGLRNLTTAPRNIGSFQRQSAISIAGRVSQKRYISERPDGRGRLYEFDDVLSILENPSDSRLLIDVREPHEYDANSIPTAINLPITSHPDALLLSESEFQDQFGFAKPPTNKEVVFFCKAGVRSKAAAGIARQAGYTNVGEYMGSWNDWQKRGGPGTKSPPEAGGLGERTGPVTETKISGGKTSGEEDVGEQGVPQPPTGGQFGKQ